MKIKKRKETKPLKNAVIIQIFMMILLTVITAMLSKHYIDIPIVRILAPLAITLIILLGNIVQQKTSRESNTSIYYSCGMMMMIMWILIDILIIKGNFKSHWFGYLNIALSNFISVLVIKLFPQKDKHKKTNIVKLYKSHDG